MSASTSAGKTAGRTSLGPGISVLTDGRLSVRVRDRKGSDEMVTAHFEPHELLLAREAVVEARSIRAAGSSVRAHWAKGALETNRPVTFGEVVDAWTEERTELLEISDKIRAGNHKGVTSLRPSSFKTDQSLVTVHLLPAFGTTVTTEIDQPAVKAFIRAKSTEGYATATQGSMLSVLRKIVGSLPRSQQPDDFPWKKIQPISSVTPKKRPNVPKKYAAKKPGAKPPPIDFGTAKQIAMGMSAAFRIVIYLVWFMGLRRGEAMGLDVRHVTVDSNGVMWITIEQQRELKMGRLYRWTKSDNSYRTLPVPATLARYIESYLARYHNGYHPSVPCVYAESRQLVATSTGRAVGGGFMAATPSAWQAAFREALDGNGLTHDLLGYQPRPHDGRKSFVSHALKAKKMLVAIDDAELGEEPLDDERAQLGWIREQLRRLRQREQAGLVGRHVSAWIGHDLESDPDEDDRDAPSSLTTGTYEQRDDTDEPFLEIAQIIDRIIQHKCGDLVDEPDERDLISVIDPSNGRWVNLQTAAMLTGISAATLSTGVRSGSYEATLCWFADDDRNPPGPRYAFRRKEIDRIVARKQSLTISAASRVTGLGRQAVSRLASQGAIAVTEVHRDLTYLNAASVEDIRKRVLAVVVTFVPGDRTVRAGGVLASMKRNFDPMAAARDLYRAGASVATICSLTEIEENTLRSRMRREDWVREPTPTTATAPADLHLLFPAPHRLTLAQISNWLRKLRTEGLIESSGNGYRAAQAGPGRPS